MRFLLALTGGENPYWRTAACSAWNRVRRHRTALMWLTVLIAIIVVALLALAIAHREEVERWISQAPAYGVWIILLAAMHAGTHIVRRRRDLTARLSASWITATPRGAQTLQKSIA